MPLAPSNACVGDACAARRAIYEDDARDAIHTRAHAARAHTRSRLAEYGVAATSTVIPHRNHPPPKNPRHTNHSARPAPVMSFKTRPHSYQFDRAPTGRARCRRCHVAVPKGALRCRIVVFVCPGRAHTFVRCLPCVARDAAFVAAALAAHGGRESVPIEASLTDAERQSVLRAMR